MALHLCTHVHTRARTHVHAHVGTRMSTRMSVHRPTRTNTVGGERANPVGRGLRDCHMYVCMYIGMAYIVMVHVVMVYVVCGPSRASSPGLPNNCYFQLHPNLLVTCSLKLLRTQWSRVVTKMLPAIVVTASTESSPTAALRVSACVYARAVERIALRAGAGQKPPPLLPRQTRSSAFFRH